MRKSIMNISAIASIMAIAIAITSLCSPSSASSKAKAGFDFDPLLYIEGMAGKGMLKEYSGSRKLTRVKAAELYSRLYARTMGDDYSLPRIEDRLKDTNDGYAVAATGLGFMKARSGKFSPKVSVTVDEFTGSLSRVMAASPEALARLKAAAGMKKTRISDISRFSPSNRETAKLLAAAGVLGSDPKGRLGPRKAITEGAALGAAKRLGLIVRESSVALGYTTRNALGYALPKSESTDILFGITSSNNLKIYFAGVFDFGKKLDIGDVHYQAVKAITSGKSYPRADLVELLDYISSRWDSTAKRYGFAKDAWIKNGRVVYSKPSGNYISIRSGIALDVTLSRSGKK